MVKMCCQSCGKALRFQEKHLGRKIHCPHCGHPQVLQGATDTAAAEDAAPTQGPPRGDVSAFATAVPALRDSMREAVREGSRLKPSATRVGNQYLRPPEEDDEIGRLGGYRVLSQIGAGGMGVVYLAEDIELKRKVALKVLPPAMLSDPSAKERFYREARAAATLEHENIVIVHQVNEDQGVPYLAMSLLKGHTLEQELRDRDLAALPLDDVLQIGLETAAGLKAAHEKGLVHRDIKPANIWLEDISGRSATGKRFRVKILDFGLARLVNQKSTLTQTGIIVGTPSYMSPEQARGPQVDSRSDLFSLGSVLYEIATGRRPFPGEDSYAVLSSLAVDIPVPPIELNIELPEDLSDLIMELLEKNVAHRPQRAGDVIDRLRQISRDRDDRDSSSVTEEIPIPPTGRRPRRTRKSARPRGNARALWVWGAASAVMLLVGLGGAWMAMSPPPPPPAPPPPKNGQPPAVPAVAPIDKKDPKDVNDFPPPKDDFPPFPKKDDGDDFKKKKEDDFKKKKFGGEDDFKKKKKDGPPPPPGLDQFFPPDEFRPGQPPPPPPKKKDFD